MSLESSFWSLPQIVCVLEGGNANFLHYMNHVDRRLDYHKMFGSRSKRPLATRNILDKNELKVDERDLVDVHPFEKRYKNNKKVDTYRANLSSKITEACKMYGGNLFQNSTACMIAEQDSNDGTSLATFLVLQARKEEGKTKLAEGLKSLVLPKTSQKDSYSLMNNSKLKLQQRSYMNKSIRSSRSSVRVNKSIRSTQPSVRVNMTSRNNDDHQRRVKKDPCFEQDCQSTTSTRKYEFDIAWDYMYSSSQSSKWIPTKRGSLDSMTNPLMMGDDEAGSISKQRVHNNDQYNQLYITRASS